MPTMIPSLDPAAIENDGERLFYEAASRLPPEYTVFYSYRFKTQDQGEEGGRIWEADFVIVHPGLGYVVVEVKEGGQMLYTSGAWHEYHGKNAIPLHKDPAEQACRAMYAIRDRYRELSKGQWFPLKMRFALGFPQCDKIMGQLPPDLRSRTRSDGWSARGSSRDAS